MSVTLDAQSIDPSQWYSLNTLYAVAVGTAITVHNLSTQMQRISISSTQPTVNGANWLPLYPEQPATVSVGDLEVWVYGTGVVNIQVP